MRLGDLIQDLVLAGEQEARLEYEVKVILDGNEFSIDRVEPGPDGVLIILEREVWPGCRGLGQHGQG